MPSQKKQSHIELVKESPEQEEATGTSLPKISFWWYLLRFLGGVLLAILGAILLTLAFPPYEIWPLVFVGFVPTLVAAHRIIPRRICGLALGLGVGGFLGGYYFLHYIETGEAFLLYFPFIVGVLVFFAGARQQKLHTQIRYRWFVLHGVITWVGFEMIRGIIPFLGTAAFLANPLYGQSWLIQPVSVFGIHGLSLIIIMVNFVLALLVVALIDNRWPGDSGEATVSMTAARRWLYATVLILSGWIIFSIVLKESPPPVTRVAAVQPGEFTYETEINDKTSVVTRDSVQFQEDFDMLLEITREVAEKNASLITWNASVLPFNPQIEGKEILQDFVQNINVYLVLDYFVEEEGFNETSILSPDGVFLGTTHQTLIGHLGSISSRELDFTESLRQIVREGVNVVTVSTRESPELGCKRLAHHVFRAVENRVPIIRADAQHVSAVIDPYGRLKQYTVSRQPQRETLVAEIPLGSGDTVVVEWGDWVGWICLVGLFAFVGRGIISFFREKNRRFRKHHTG